MPTLVREVADERDGLLAFLDAQRAALRRAVHGLSDEQAAARPTAGALSLGRLIKHLTGVERNWSGLLADSPEPIVDPGFDMLPGETLSGLLADYDTATRRTDALVRAFPDLDRPLDFSHFDPVLPPGIARSARWVVLHLVEETARHAGHADIVRESLDGATAMELVLATGTTLIT